MEDEAEGDPEQAQVRREGPHGKTAVRGAGVVPQDRADDDVQRDSDDGDRGHKRDTEPGRRPALPAAEGDDGGLHEGEQEEEREAPEDRDRLEPEREEAPGEGGGGAERAAVARRAKMGTSRFPTDPRRPGRNPSRAISKDVFVAAVRFAPRAPHMTAIPTRRKAPSIPGTGRLAQATRAERSRRPPPPPSAAH